jgi:hypothetical protein
MAGPLGCAAKSDYVALVTDRHGGQIVDELTFAGLAWSRAVNGISEAKLTVPMGCCDRLGSVRSWRHELMVVRGDNIVWQGPITGIPNSRDQVELQARDPLQWLRRRVVRKRRCSAPSCGGEPTPGTTVAHQLITDALEPDDPGVLEHLTIAADSGLVARDFKVYSGYAYDALRDLVGVVDFTAVGKRIVLMPKGHLLGRTAVLTCDAFLGDVGAIEDGLSAASRAVVVGAGVTGSAGWIDPYFGLIEVLVKDDKIKTRDDANTQARGVVRGAMPPPLRVDVPSGAHLAADAPVSMDELVPGVGVPVLLDCTCRDAQQLQRLRSLSVTVNADGEQVAPVLLPPGSDEDGGQVAPE